MKQYIDMLNNILISKYHVTKPTRTGIDTLSLTGQQFVHDMRNGFPLITTKKVSLKNVAVELEFFIKGLSDKRWLQERGCHIWDEWANLNSLPNDNIKSKYSYMEKSNDLGPIYGFEWRNFNGWYKPNPQIITDFDTEYIKYIDMSTNNSGIVGKLYKSNRFDEFCVIKEYYIGKTLRFDIKFLSNGYVLTNVTKQNILSGQCRNHYYPNICGVGCIGDKNIIGTYLYKKLRSVWESMLSRCYDTSDSCYYLYGKRGVYVSNRWLILSNFLIDCQTLINWELKVNDWSQYSLDKDYFGEGYYSKDTCMWLSRENQVLNSRMVNKNFNAHLYKYGTDQLKNIIELAKKDIFDRRLIVSAWNPLQLNQMALPPCHYSWQILSDGKVLDLIFNIRSWDFFLGGPYNIASYGLLLLILAKELNLTPRLLIGNGGDVHIYTNHIQQVSTQLMRTPYPLPTVTIPDENWKGALEWTYKDFELTNYTSHPALKADIAI
jgi:thymidylate synthase